MTTSNRATLIAALLAERNAVPKWWQTPDPAADQHREDLAFELSDWRDPDYELRKYAPTQAEQADAFIEDVDWMLRSGESAARICQRVNSNRTAIARRLGRAGRHDLAQPFYTVRAEA